MNNRPYVQGVASAQLATASGEFRICVYVDRDNKEQVALVMGEVRGDEPVLTRLHSECLTGDVFHSLRCDCRPQLEAALRAIARAGRGVLLYLRQEGRGIGLANKIRAYALQQQGLDTVEANEKLGLPVDDRDYGVAAAILRDLGVAAVRLFTNNPEKVSGLASHGIQVAERVSAEVKPNKHNRAYLRVKKKKFGHVLRRVK